MESLRLCGGSTPEQHYHIPSALIHAPRRNKALFEQALKHPIGDHLFVFGAHRFIAGSEHFHTPSNPSIRVVHLGPMDSPRGAGTRYRRADGTTLVVACGNVQGRRVGGAGCMHGKRGAFPFSLASLCCRPTPRSRKKKGKFGATSLRWEVHRQEPLTLQVGSIGDSCRVAHACANLR